MSSPREIATTLVYDGYKISTRNEVITALQEDLGYSEEEAVSLADEIIKESKSL